MRQARPTKGAAVIMAAARMRRGLLIGKDFMMHHKIGMGLNDDVAGRLHPAGQSARQASIYMLLAGRIGGAGRCGGRGYGLSGTSASEARITLTGGGGVAPRRRRRAADRLPTKVRTSMGLLLESPPNGQGLAPWTRQPHLTLMYAGASRPGGEPGQPFATTCVVP